jgi:bisanhydrobacterioruberin hydratase
VKNSISRYHIATSIAILFHVIGIVGILFFNRDFFIGSTPFNLLLMFVLLVYTQPKPTKGFWIFVISCFVIGIAVEIIGVNTGILFGNYKYGNVLGTQFKNVPLLIGINWFIIIYCCGISVHSLLMKIIKTLPQDAPRTATTLKALSVIVDGATLAVFFDWLMEPVAVKLGYWHWSGSGSIPIYNYICCFLVSMLLLLLFHFCKFEKQNKFAVNLLLIQVMFFLLLRTFLK